MHVCVLAHNASSTASPQPQPTTYQSRPNLNPHSLVPTSPPNTQPHPNLNAQPSQPHSNLSPQYTSRGRAEEVVMALLTTKLHQFFNCVVMLLA